MKVKCKNCGFVTEAKNCVICPYCGHVAKPFTERKVKKESKETVEHIELQKLID